ncbi:unnamed protein product, partial [Mesorhabditis belari]|uniref:Uncharacterized protein n=1 Tax=Mesorhabditis belari TaxID=2138241 RepID=A0AAF3FH46_9BILA
MRSRRNTCNALSAMRNARTETKIEDLLEPLASTGFQGHRGIDDQENDEFIDSDEKLTQPSGINEIALANLHILEKIRDQLKPIEPKLPKDEHEAKKGQESIKLNGAEKAKDEIQKMISRMLDDFQKKFEQMFETKLQHWDPAQHQPNNINPETDKILEIPPGEDLRSIQDLQHWDPEQHQLNSTNRKADESLEIPPGEDLGSIQEVRPEGSSAAGNLDSYVSEDPIFINNLN